MKKFCKIPIGFMLAALVLSGCSAGKSAEPVETADKETSKMAIANNSDSSATPKEESSAMDEGTASESDNSDESVIIEVTDSNSLSSTESFRIKIANNSVASQSAKNIDAELDSAVGEAVFTGNEGTYLEGELQTEGHIVLDTSSVGGDTVVYALTMYGEYGFENDTFVKVAGSGTIPVVMTFGYSKDSGYQLKNYSVPTDGSGYVQSIKDMFPQSLYNRVLSISESDSNNLTSQERTYAKAYLNKIGRSARIAENAEKEYVDVDAEVSNEVSKRYWEYPSWIGTQEKIENNVRYVYETQWKNYGGGDSMIYFTKYVYNTGEIIKSINVYIEDDKIASSEEKVTKIIGNK